MQRAIRRGGLAALLVTSVSILAAFPGVPSGLSPQSAHAASTKSVAKGDLTTCHSMRVVLNGNAAPTVTCIDSTLSPQGQVSPNSQPSGCYNGDMFVYSDPYGLGDHLCFTGTGTTTLSNIPGWNDRVSSYSSGSWAGKFYDNSDLTGATWSFGASNTVYTFNAQFDNRASSICVAAAGPSGCP